LSTSSAARSRLMITGAALLWSTGGAAIKLSSATASQLTVGRAIVAGAVIYLLLPAARARWTKPVLFTAIFYALTCTLFVFANTLTTAGNTIFIQNTAPIWVLLLGPWLLRERATFAEKLSVPISLLGCLLFFLDDMSAGRLTGNLIAFGASITFAMSIMSYRKVNESEGLSATIAGNAMIALVLAPLAFTDPAPAASDYGIFLYLGAIQQAGGAVLFIRGIRGVSALEGSLLTLLEPLFSPIWAFLLVGEALGPLALLGAALVLGATVLRVRATPRTSGRAPS
jgi:drug/metabolite transporter (DMT)-like permease